METAYIAPISFVINYLSMFDNCRLDAEMSNYGRWKYLVTIVLETLNLRDYIDQGVAADEAQLSPQQDRAVVCMISATLQSETLLYVQSCTTARAVMRALEDAWSKVSEFKVYELRNQLHNIQKKKLTKVDAYISQVKEIRGKLASYGQQISEDTMIDCAVKGLEVQGELSSVAIQVNAIRTNRQRELTFEEVAHYMRVAEARANTKGYHDTTPYMLN